MLLIVERQAEGVKAVDVGQALVKGESLAVVAESKAWIAPQVDRFQGIQLKQEEGLRLF